MLQLLALLLPLLPPPVCAPEPAAQDVSLGVVSGASPAPVIFTGVGVGGWEREARARLLGQIGGCFKYSTSDWECRLGTWIVGSLKSGAGI